MFTWNKRRGSFPLTLFGRTAGINVAERDSAVLSAVRRFNELRSPEATAELVHAEGDLIVVKISGSFCFTCGLYDYFDDLAWELRDRLEESVEIEAVEQIDPESYLALYRIGTRRRGRESQDRSSEG